jgi:non-heme chloroperoxidase
MTPALQSVDLPGRVRLPYAEQGDPAGVPVVLLHGVTDCWRSFQGVLPHLPDSIHAFALTQRGHGDAERPATGYLARDFAADVASFVEVLGLGPAVVVGHSMGASNAQRLAIDHPGHVRGLLFTGTFAGYRNNAAVREFYESTISTLEDPLDPAFVREFQESTLARPVPAAFVDAMVAESLKVPARVWRAAFAGFLEDDAGELDRIRAPTLVVWGDRDAYCPREDQSILVEKIPGSRWITYEGHGHSVHWEAPERFAADLVAFVREVTR